MGNAMEIRKIRLNNVGRFTDLEVAFAPTEKHASKVTVFVGNNGAGKTTILKSLATSLSWLAARIRTDNASGSPIPQDVIKNGASIATIQVDVADSHFSSDITQTDFSWTLSRAQRGRLTSRNTSLKEATQLAGFYRYQMGVIDENYSTPLIVFYPVERSITDIPLGIRKSHKAFDQLDGYENSISSGGNFNRFFEWFRDREDIENETTISSSAIKGANLIPGIGGAIVAALEAMRLKNQDPQLAAVRSAISEFMPHFSNLRIKRKPRLHMAFDKDGHTLNVSQLSQGERTLMALVGDIARRLAMMNPALEDPLNGAGVVMIDEVDLHLHPQWQRRLIHQLTETFPNCQFILTTHSPLVISDTKDVLCYVLDDGELEERNGLYGLDANQVLLSVMDTDVRNSDVQDRLDRLLDLLQDKKLKEAKALFEELSADLPPGHIELTKASLLIRKLELRSA